MSAFADSDKPLRARDLCLVRDLPIVPFVPKNTDSIRSTLNRLVSRGILTENEPGLFARPTRNPAPKPTSSGPHPTPTL
ncbi:hypothetical protein [Streptomyces sp. YGL11-2]|uniref:hypothetical protein n=1 Tax=Streptomyces sp. YGL11-2 TaxID=3414028 RepID=UPI003CE6C259